MLAKRFHLQTLVSSRSGGCGSARRAQLPLGTLAPSGREHSFSSIPGCPITGLLCPVTGCFLALVGPKSYGIDSGEIEGSGRTPKLLNQAPPTRRPLSRAGKAKERTGLQIRFDFLKMYRKRNRVCCLWLNADLVCDRYRAQTQWFLTRPSHGRTPT